MSYYQKYLKYKNKYLKLKSQIGGINQKFFNPQFLNPPPNSNQPNSYQSPFSQSNSYQSPFSQSPFSQSNSYQSGFNQPNSYQSSFSQSGFNQPNSYQSGFSQSGFNQPPSYQSGFNQQNSNNQSGFNQSRFNQQNSNNQSGFNQQNSNNQSGFNQQNSNNQSGFNQPPSLKKTFSTSVNDTKVIKNQGTISEILKTLLSNIFFPAAYANDILVTPDHTKTGIYFSIKIDNTKYAHFSIHFGQTKGRFSRTHIVDDINKMTYNFILENNNNYKLDITEQDFNKKSIYFKIICSEILSFINNENYRQLIFD